MYVLFRAMGYLILGLKYFTWKLTHLFLIAFPYRSFQGSFWALRTDGVNTYKKIIGIRTTGYGFVSRVSDLSDVLFDQELLHI